MVASSKNMGRIANFTTRILPEDMGAWYSFTLLKSNQSPNFSVLIPNGRRYPSNFDYLLFGKVVTVVCPFHVNCAPCETRPKGGNDDVIALAKFRFPLPEA